MKIPKPDNGLVINYSFLWNDELKQGKIEGRKDRPCAVVITMKSNKVAVLAITHSQPKPNTRAFELPQHIKKDLGLDSERSWVITSEVNIFDWPGFDLRPIKNKDSVVYGKLPTTVLKKLTVIVQERIQGQQIKITNRNEKTPEQKIINPVPKKSRNDDFGL